MLNYLEVQKELKSNPKKWLVTGCAGFIGSNLSLKLLELGQSVTGIDNMSTGQQRNIDEISKEFNDFEFIKGDIRDLEAVKKCVTGKDYVLQQAALGSVPRSIANPLDSHNSNVNGFLNMLIATRDEKVPMVYASSSSVYGDHPDLPKVEENIGQPLSPYAATKAIDELYSNVFSLTYDVNVTGLRYFNVFGPRQTPDGPYAAVIPKWIARILRGEPVEIFGDGETSRDFCFIENAVQANIMAAFHSDKNKSGEVYNIAAGRRTTLTELFNIIVENLLSHRPDLAGLKATYKDFRPGDVRHSLADISKAQKNIKYQPTHDVLAGLSQGIDWYVENL